MELVDSKAGYGIQLENVKFGYRPELPILQVCSLTSLETLHGSPAAHTRHCSPYSLIRHWGSLR